MRESVRTFLLRLNLGVARDFVQVSGCAWGRALECAQGGGRFDFIVGWSRGSTRPRCGRPRGA